MKCKYCGKEFETDDQRRKFCSAECYKLYYNDYRNNKIKKMYANDPEYAKERSRKTNEINKSRVARIRREAMLYHANQLVMLSHKSDAEELIADYLLQNFNMRSK